MVVREMINLKNDKQVKVLIVYKIINKMGGLPYEFNEV